MLDRQRHIIVAPLNWGLGHATRCIPIIQALISRKCKITIASDGDALELLRKEFPTIEARELPSYRISYSRRLPSLHILSLLPNIAAAIKEEKKVIHDLVSREHVDAIISDNRYGCYHESVRSVYMGHQLSLPIHAVVAPTVNAIHHHFIRRFDEVWVPDFADQRLTGKMSVLSGDASISYVGPLSRFEKIPGTTEKNQIACVLSGPEPHRSDLEKILLEQLSELNIPSILVRGKISDSSAVSNHGHVQIIDYMLSRELNRLLVESSIVIMRSGYSSIMDLVKLQKKAILIPTPHQPEQMYLVKRIKKQGWAVVQEQDQINLREGVAQSNKLLEHKDGNTLSLDFLIDKVLDKNIFQ